MKQVELYFIINKEKKQNNIDMRIKIPENIELSKKHDTMILIRAEETRHTNKQIELKQNIFVDIISRLPKTLMGSRYKVLT